MPAAHEDSGFKDEPALRKFLGLGNPAFMLGSSILLGEAPWRLTNVGCQAAGGLTYRRNALRLRSGRRSDHQCCGLVCGRGSALVFPFFAGRL